MQVTNILSLENEASWKKHAISFADSGKAEVVYFYSCRMEHRATEVQLLLILKQKYWGLYIFTADNNCCVKGLM